MAMPSQLVGELLVRWRAGDREALETLVPLVYKELREIAHYHLQRERRGAQVAVVNRFERSSSTLETSPARDSAALVHETYLRLVDQNPFHADNRAHFLGVASRLMRQILVDYARNHAAAKRGADLRVELDAALVLPHERSAEVIALDDALKALTQMDEQQGQIVELRFFGGLTVEEIAAVLDGVTVLDSSAGGIGGCPFAPGSSFLSILEGVAHVPPLSRNPASTPFSTV